MSCSPEPCQPDAPVRSADPSSPCPSPASSPGWSATLPASWPCNPQPCMHSSDSLHKLVLEILNACSISSSLSLSSSPPGCPISLRYLRRRRLICILRGATATDQAAALPQTSTPHSAALAAPPLHSPLRHSRTPSPSSLYRITLQRNRHILYHHLPECLR